MKKIMIAAALCITVLFPSCSSVDMLDSTTVQSDSSSTVTTQDIDSTIEMKQTEYSATQTTQTISTATTSIEIVRTTKSTTQTVINTTTTAKAVSNQATTPTTVKASFDEMHIEKIRIILYWIDFYKGLENEALTFSRINSSKAASETEMKYKMIYTNKANQFKTQADHYKSLREKNEEILKEFTADEIAEANRLGMLKSDTTYIH